MIKIPLEWHIYIIGNRASYPEEKVEGVLDGPHGQGFLSARQVDWQVIEPLALLNHLTTPARERETLSIPKGGIGCHLETQHIFARQDNATRKQTFTHIGCESPTGHAPQLLRYQQLTNITNKTNKTTTSTSFTHPLHVIVCWTSNSMLTTTGQV